MFSRDQFVYEPLDLPDRMDLSDAEMAQQAAAFYDQMKRRHTVRDYTDRPVAREIIEECVRVAGTAPSGANHQPWHFVAISDPAFKHRFQTPHPTGRRRGGTQVL